MNNKTSSAEIKRLLGMKEYYPRQIIHPTPTTEYYYLSKAVRLTCLLTGNFNRWELRMRK